MADGDYKRLGCAADGCSKQAGGGMMKMCQAHYTRFKTYGYTGDHKATCKHCGVEFFAKDKRSSKCADCAKKEFRPSIGSKKCSIDGCDNLCGKARGLCSLHYAKWHYEQRYKAKPKPCICKTCGVEFQKIHKNKYCSKECKNAALLAKAREKLGQLPKDERNQLKRKQSKWAAYCMTCNAWFWREPGGKNRQRRSFNKFCSKECAYEMSKKVTAERDALLRMGIHYENKKAKEKQNAIMRVARAIRDVAENRRKLESMLNPCKTCGKPVGYSFGRSRIFCSKECLTQDMKQRPEYKEQMRAYRKRRKALQRGAQVGESFSYKQIFERDKWKCRMCGVKTPASLRGTYEPNAPELDHIMPLSKGGTHSIDNAQLLCRQCNQWKSDKVLPHQQGLFTALL